jgi:protein TonB
MSRTKDPLHVPWAFSLTEAPRLPLTGEKHPLDREFWRSLGGANLAVLLLGLAAFAAWVLAGRAQDATPDVRQIKIVRYTELGVPPSIARPAAPQINVARAVAPPTIGIPEPVPDEQAVAPTIATQEEIREVLEPIPLADLGGGAGDSLVIEEDIDTSPSPEDFVAVEVEPVRVHIDAPVYPPMAAEAGIEGTVLVNVLIGKDGKVKKAMLVEGSPLLDEAAVACAKTAVFRPALMQNQPVEVWVLMPITFKLRN